ncbi:transcriptional regulator, TetR family [Caminicella sporogenes DSM 14501]|uniref:Transcriptional regulator, TetR family n=1 Tax=Caminicella sporogenes DSM 14501 TaxID=1121266 RepID=A0A1M6TGC7_9FIRM|nr:TetR/AcrR family transcriptional regulator [Caminicella sporogenes]RKD24932.1 hypothetical protein BET04_11570 [Caminicella sporogenes]WIF95983.1 TetR/AcrR family transcriptional regulator [Caminicella sporogenes]SHK55964.1 transcriptional regulator, TetR family [Caminicella sporogenes DSM 14501]
MNNREEKRRDILIAAFKIFGRDGFYKAKVSDIAKEANVGKGTIYEYFESKENVFEEMVKFGIEQYLKKVTLLIYEEDDVIEKLKKYVLAEKEMMIEYGNIANIFFQEADKIGKEVREIVIKARNRKLSLIEDIVKEGIKKEIFKNIDAYLFSLAFIGGVHQFLVDEIRFFASNKKVYTIEDFINLFLNGIKK